MKIRIAVVFGGNSTEHEISVISAVQAMQSFDAEKYDIIPVYMTKGNDFYTSPSYMDIAVFRNLPTAVSSGVQVDFIKDGVKVYLQRHNIKKFGENRIREIDMVFPIVHGTNVEDGTLTGFFKTLSVPVVGCDVLSSALGMDKAAMKAVFASAGIPVLPCVTFTRKDEPDTDTIISRVKESFSYPVIVKPANLGSSIGITLAHDDEELKEALELAFSLAPRVIVERAITSLREINCAVIGDIFNAEASECEEPLSGGGILDFEDKYMRGGKSGKGKTPSVKGAGTKGGGSKGSGMASLSRKIPADISAEMRDEIRETAVRAFHAIGASGVSRIDFMIDTADNDKLYLNEINTIPGSLAFYLFEPLGISYGDLLTRMVDIALDAEREKQKTVYTFETNVLEQARI